MPAAKCCRTDSSVLSPMTCHRLLLSLSGPRLARTDVLSFGCTESPPRVVAAMVTESYCSRLCPSWGTGKTCGAPDVPSILAGRLDSFVSRIEIRRTQRLEHLTPRSGPAAGHVAATVQVLARAVAKKDQQPPLGRGLDSIHLAHVKGYRRQLRQTVNVAPEEVGELAQAGVAGPANDDLNARTCETLRVHVNGRFERTVELLQRHTKQLEPTDVDLAQAGLVRQPEVRDLDGCDTYGLRRNGVDADPIKASDHDPRMVEPAAQRRTRPFLSLYPIDDGQIVAIGQIDGNDIVIEAGALGPDLGRQRSSVPTVTTDPAPGIHSIVLVCSPSCNPPSE